jgi:hypothetical protein
LRQVDTNVEALRASGVSFQQLVRPSRYIRRVGSEASLQDYAVALPKEYEMRPRDKYWTYPGSRSMKWFAYGFRKPIQRAPCYLKRDFRLNPKGL